MGAGGLTMEVLRGAGGMTALEIREETGVDEEIGGGGVAADATDAEGVADGMGGFTLAAIGGGIRAWTAPEATEAALRREAEEEDDEAAGMGGKAAPPDDEDEEGMGGLGSWEGTAKGMAEMGMLGSAELERGIEAGMGEGIEEEEEEGGGVEVERPAATAALAWATVLIPLTDLPLPLNDDADP